MCGWVAGVVCAAGCRSLAWGCSANAYGGSCTSGTVVGPGSKVVFGVGDVVAQLGRGVFGRLGVLDVGYPLLEL